MLVQLEQSPVVRLASDGQIRKTLRLMGLHADTPLKSEVSRELCQRIGGTVVLGGSISMLGNEYVLGLRARRCNTGEELAAEQIQVAKKERVLGALSQIATRFRIRFGEASSSVKELDTPLAEATTSSLDALKAFSEAIRTFNAKGSKAALPLFQRATELDPQFAMAHVWLGRMHADLGDEAASIESTQQAYALRERTSDRERFSVDVSYEVLVTGNLEKAKVACEAWIAMYPRDVYPRTFLSALVYPAYGQYEKALEEAQSAIRIDPDFVIGYRNAALNLIALNRLDEANQVLQEAARRKLFLPSFITDAYRIAFLKGDVAGMNKAAEAAPSNPWLLHYQASTLALAGRLTQAQVLEDQAVRLMEHALKPETEAQLLVSDAFTKMLYGYPEAAVKEVRLALNLSSDRNVEHVAALILAMTGDSGEALKLATDLRQRFAQDTLVSNNYIPTIEAALALRGNQPQRTVELLRETTPFELSQPLYPTFIRGQAFLAMGRAREASVEFRKIVDHPGLVLNDPLLNLAQMYLAKSYVLAGDRDRARSTYDSVLQRWKDADPGLPALQQAKRERVGI
jgi:tetratricopeptide (TPR) repeat protein